VDRRSPGKRRLYVQFAGGVKPGASEAVNLSYVVLQLEEASGAG
jgi:hypothetical protein